MSDCKDPVESMEEVEHMCDDTNGLTEMTDLNDIPSALIIAHIDTSVFEDKEAQELFERIFRDLDKDVTFIYLRNFRRSRVQFSSPDLAAIARVRYDGVVVCGSSIRCFFVKVPTPTDPDSSHLRPPSPQRMFLISPPASPPVGWAQVREAEPIVNYELLHAIAKLSPADQGSTSDDLTRSDSHTLVQSTQDAPAIVVHLCEDPVAPPPEFKPKLVPTKMPPRINPS